MLAQGEKRTVLVTGASSGIGLTTAVQLAAKGFQVFAAMRDPSRKSALEAAADRAKVSVNVLGLDVTEPDDIDRAVEKVIASSGRIDALVNNAGIQLRGYFEDLNESEIRNVFETNVFGTMALTRAVLPHMRSAREGRIVMVTSIGGRMGAPALSSYCASKFALEGFGECLALEVAPFGIKVVLVEPAIVRTEIWGANRNVAQNALSPLSLYHKWFKRSEELADWAVASSPTTPEHVAEAISRALTARTPSLRYLVGRRASLVLAVRRFLPAGLFDKIYSDQIIRRITSSPDSGSA